MGTTYGSKSNYGEKALSFAVERDNLIQCFDAMEATGSSDFPDMAGVYSGSGVMGSPVLNTSDNNIKYYTLDGSDTFRFQQYSQPYTCTLSAWIRINDTNAIETLCSHISGGPVSTYYYILETGYMGFGYYDGSWKTIVGTGSVVDDNVWHHCVWARSGTNHRFYVDGSLDTNLTMDSAMSGTINVIGARWAGGYPFNGDIAHFSQYNIQLSATQVANMHNHQRYRFGV